MKNFEDFAVEMKPMIHKIIQNLHIYKNQEEYYQIGFIHLWKAYDTFDPEKGTLKQYTFNCIRHSILNELQKNSLVEKRELISDDNQWTSFYEEPSHEQHLFLKDLIQNLPSKQQHFLELHYIKGMKLTEIMDIFEVSYSTIKMWKRDLKERLYKYWNEEI